jgi:hypothetical protein
MSTYDCIRAQTKELTRRLSRIFLRDEAGRRAVFGEHPKLQHDRHFRDHVLFYEYFHGARPAPDGKAAAVRVGARIWPHRYQLPS